MNGSEWLVLAGNYGSAAEETIQLLVFRPEAGTLEPAGGAGGIDNPSYLAVDGERGLLYAVSETGNGWAAAYRLDRETMTLREINRQPVHGDGPCHVSLDPARRLLHVANYGSGSYSVLTVGAGGELGPLAGRAIHAGSSVHPERQAGPHAHSAYPDPSGRVQLVCDLGIDEIVIYESGADGRPVKTGSIAAPAGSGPRHLAFHPTMPLLYVAAELTSRVLAYAFEPGGRQAELVQEADMLPAGWGGASIAADIHVHPSGRWLYATNRGHDSLAVFGIGAAGRLTSRGHVPTGGAWPRNFMILPDGRHLLAANQDSGTVVPFRIGADGMPAAYGTPLQLAKPVCLAAVPLA